MLQSRRGQGYTDIQTADVQCGAICLPEPLEPQEQNQNPDTRGRRDRDCLAKRVQPSMCRSTLASCWTHPHATVSGCHRAAFRPQNFGFQCFQSVPSLCFRVNPYGSKHPVDLCRHPMPIAGYTSLSADMWGSSALCSLSHFFLQAARSFASEPKPLLSTFCPRQVSSQTSCSFSGMATVKQPGQALAAPSRDDAGMCPSARCDHK